LIQASYETKMSKLYTRLSKEQKSEKIKQHLEQINSLDQEIESVQSGFTRVYPVRLDQLQQKYDTAHDPQLKSQLMDQISQLQQR
jgi:hypothetical protein